MQLTDQTILLTGASSGIGRELALVLSRNRCRLILIARRRHLLEKLVHELSPASQPHLFYDADLADSTEVDRVCRNLSDAGIVPDILFLNAGMGGDFSALDMDLQKIEKLFSLNFFSVLRMIKYFLPAMADRRWGWIVVTSSLAGYRGMPAAADYSASKSALSVFAESLRLDLWDMGIGVMVISPGFVRTPMTADHRFKMPFLMSAQKAAKIIVRGLQREKLEIHFPYRLSLLARASRFLPASAYARLMHNRRKLQPQDLS
ncbi:SDR family NAD(P)-dependent oxidoreductase [candidate division KSB1 bacterium]|nr:SDR family NAD(P)-dependent oxidoreductase [candidate division KSB1 bacterium]